MASMQMFQQCPSKMLPTKFWNGSTRDELGQTMGQTDLGALRLPEESLGGTHTGFDSR